MLNTQILTKTQQSYKYSVNERALADSSEKQEKYPYQLPVKELFGRAIKDAKDAVKRVLKPKNTESQYLVEEPKKFVDDKESVASKESNNISDFLDELKDLEYRFENLDRENKFQCIQLYADVAKFGSSVSWNFSRFKYPKGNSNEVDKLYKSSYDLECKFTQLLN
jgi:hypothetical protein